jgi:protocatechuate 3,4-dioxygenase beta subunit
MKRPTRLAAPLVVLLAAALSFFRVSPAEPTAPKPETVRLEGRVVDAAGKPAGDVLVETVWLGRRYDGRTSADGRFAIDIHASGFGGRLRAATPDGRQQAFLGLNDDESVKSKGNARSGLELVLKPAREVEVAVNDAAGKPVAGAWVMAASDYAPAGETTTDDSGKATLRLPADAAPMYVLASKDGVGLDYVLFWRKDQPHTDPYRLDPDHKGPLLFVLNGAKEITVRAADEQGRPLAGVEIYPWLFQKPRKGDDVNLSGIPAFKRKTDASGAATFFVPADNTGPVTFWPQLSGYTAPKRTTWDPKTGGERVDATLAKQIRVTGRVLDEQGKPAAGARVRVGGDGYEIDSFRGETRTADDGTFAIDVDPQQYYLFLADRGPLASRAVMRVVRKEAPAPVELALAPAAKVTGAVTAGAGGKAVPGASVTLVSSDDEQSYLKLPPEQQFPGGVSGRKAIMPSVSQHGKAGADGSFEFYAGPGLHQVMVYANGAQKQMSFQIADDLKQYTILHFQPAREPEKEAHDVAEGRVVRVDVRLDEVPGAKPTLAKGRVVDRDTGAAVAEAALEGAYTSPDDFFRGATADANGNFTFVRGKSDLYLSATSPDGKRRGIVLINAADSGPVEVPAGPMASAVGTLVDHEGKPLVGRSIQYGVRVNMPGGLSSTHFGGYVETNAEGRFSVESRLVPGFDYTLGVVLSYGDDGRPNSWREVGKVRADRVERVAIGSVTLPAPYRPKTWKDYLAEAFAQKRLVSERLADAQEAAQLSYQHVLVILGAPARQPCEQLYELWRRPDRRDVWEALVEYVPLAVNVDAADAETRAWAASSKLAWPEQGMTLAALDTQGKLLAQATEADLGAGGRLDAARLIDFARRHAPHKPDARKLLDEALARAKREGKHVLLDESAAYCPPCLTLSKYLEANRNLLEKDFVLVTLDRRFGNGEQVMKSLRGDGVSTPWTVVLSADGKAVMTSDGPEGNIGYPSDGTSRDHWEKMLRAGAWRLTEEEVNKLTKAAAAR